MNTIENKIKSVIFGHAVADALGVPVEAHSHEELAADPVTDMRGFGSYPVPAGSWSDDTSMSLAVLDSLADGIVDLDRIILNFGAWYCGDEYTPTGIYMLPNSELETLNKENAIWFFHAFSEKCVGGFEEIVNVLKERYYVNKFPEGEIRFSLDKMAMLVAFTAPQKPDFDDWAALDEKYYALFDEIYYVN